MSKRTIDLTIPTIDLTEEPISNRQVQNFERLFGRSVPVRRSVNNRRRRRRFGEQRVADIGALVDKISEFVPQSCRPQEQCLRGPRGSHILNTGRKCRLNRVLSKLPDSNWRAGTVVGMIMFRQHNFITKQ